MTKYMLMLCLVSGAVSAQEQTVPFYPTSQEYAFSATGSSGTAVRIAAPSSGVYCPQYRIATVGTAGTTVTVAFGTTSASVTPVVIPVPGTPQMTRTILAGAIEILSAPSQAWFNAITSTGTITIYITCGSGL